MSRSGSTNGASRIDNFASAAEIKWEFRGMEPKKKAAMQSRLRGYGIPHLLTPKSQNLNKGSGILSHRLN